jgi:hypothetical protein
MTHTIAGATLTALLAVVAADAGAEAEAGDAAPALHIVHAPIPCALAGAHPRIDARIEPDREGLQPTVAFHAEGSSQWYAVPMHRVEGTWMAALPSPKAAGVRFSYFISVAGAARGRLPEASAFIVDVADGCGAAGLPTSSRGPVEVRVPAGAALVPEGFETRGIERWLEQAAGETPPALQRQIVPSAFPALAPRSRLRVKVLDRPGDAPSTSPQPGTWFEGTLQAIEDDVLVLRAGGDSTLRVRAENLAGLEIREPGSVAIGSVGALAGAAAGFLGTILVCVSNDELCGSATPLWLGTIGGAALGGALGGSPSWKPVSVGHKHVVSLAVAPRPKGAAVGLSLAF